MINYVKINVLINHFFVSHAKPLSLPRSKDHKVQDDSGTAERDTSDEIYVKKQRSASSK